MIRTIVLVAVLSTSAAVSAATTGEDAAFRFSKPLELPSLEQEELVAVPLDVEVFSATQIGLPDLRVLDSEGHEVSYHLQRATTTREEKVRKYWQARDPSARPLEGGGLEIIVKLDKDDPLPDGLRIVSPLKNFEQRVQVFASADGKDWQPITENGLIFDYSQYMDVRNDTVPADAGNMRHFRIVIDNLTAELESQLLELTRHLRGDQESEREERLLIDRRPFRISRLEFWQDSNVERVTGDQRIAYPVRVARVENPEEESQTLIYVESHREPLTSLKLSTPARNFSRRTRVEVANTHGNERRWRTIGEATISRINFRDLDREELAVSIPESRESEYRLVIENRNSPKLSIDGVAGEGNVYELVFMAEPKAEYRLAYGDPDAKPPSYDIAAVRASLDAGYEPVRASLGKEVEVAVPKEQGWTFSRLLNNAWIMGSVIGVLVVALGWGLYRASSRLGSIPEE